MQIKKIVFNKNMSILNKIENVVIAVISVLLLIYTGYRAATLSFTIDESISFNVLTPLNVMELISYKYPLANHHMINTICMKLMSFLFGTSEFSLRLPSLISHVFYIVFSYRLIKKISPSYLVLAGFLLLNLNPYMLDLFSLARGYAMAVTFTVVSLFYLFSYVENNQIKNLNWSLLFAVLAVLSNFSLLIYYVSLIAAISLYLFASQPSFSLKDLLKKNVPLIISSVFLIAIMFEPIRKLIKGKEFYDGGLTGFWYDTVGSLIGATLYEQSYQAIASVYIRYFVGISSLVLIITLAYNYYLRKLKILTERFTVAVLLLFISCFASIAQHFLLKSNFLINRMALFFIPLFFVSIILFAAECAVDLKRKVLTGTFMYLIAGALFIHTVVSFNTSETLYWEFDADTKRMLTDLEKVVKEGEKSTVKLGVMALYEPAINFYRITRKYDWLEKVTEDGYRNMNYDYYYLGDSSMNYIKMRNMAVLKHYSTSNSCLVKCDSVEYIK
jgi:hypothetical protein